MANSSVVDNQKIAKNTILLYIRMLVMMGVQLYTSRVLLNALGVEDYGIYNVVGGVVAMFSFLNAAMTTSTQRYITYELGKNNYEKLKTVFATSFVIHVLISLIVLLLGESVGLWFMVEKIVVPADRFDAAMWVYQFSLLSTIFAFLCCPFNADIVAHERMSAFAYISISDSLMKLIIVFILINIPFDKLASYSFLLLLVQIITFIFYISYCRNKLEESRTLYTKDYSYLKEMIGFAGWNLFGNLASVLMSQGVNILLNMFFGPAVNAARAVSVQVQAALHQFSNNFQMALNPQITKSYAANETKAMHRLMYRSSRLTFFLLLIFCLPVFLEAPLILRIWLKIVPEYTVVFLRIMIVIMIIDSCANPLLTAAAATGKVRRYQTIIGSVLLLILPISYLSLEMGMAPWAVFYVQLLVSIIAFIARLFIVRSLVGLSIKEFFYNVMTRCIIVCLVSITIPSAIKELLSESIINSLIIIVLCGICAIICSFFLGLDKHERTVIINKVKSRI